MAGPVAPSSDLTPFSLQVDEIACMLNFELADHPVYEGGELQWFDDDNHGTGMLVFLARRGTRTVDYYVQRGLQVDAGGYQLAGGTGTWSESDFTVARLIVADDGVDAEVRFTDVDGRLVEVRVADRDGRVRRPAGLLAPVSAAIERPMSLLLVWMPRFDLVRAVGDPPVVRIDGVDASIGRLPAMRLHRRHLVKYASPVVTVQVNREGGGDAPMATSAPTLCFDTQGSLSGITAKRAGHHAELRLVPSFPSLPAFGEGEARPGRWHVEVDGVRLTGGTWSVARRGPDASVCLDVDEPWKPGRLPWLMRLVITVVPVFRRWPTTYRWRAELRLDPPSTMTARWVRTGTERGDSYRRKTSS